MAMEALATAGTFRNRTAPVIGLIVKQQDGSMLDLKGREAWSLHELIRSGASGCTPIDNPALRWSDCIFKLRKRGLNVETIHEAHKGAFAGTHGRYILRTPLTVVSVERRGQA
jgi:hypothetical protein